MTLRVFLCCLLLILPGVSPAATPAPNAAKRAASRPNLDLSLYRRSFLTTEKPALRLSAYNVQQVAFSIYPLDLPALIPTSKALNNFGKTLSRVDLTGRHPLKTWTVALGKIYSDQWSEKPVLGPRMPPGVYLLRANANGAEKRTWLAVTGTVLLAKRSRQTMLLYAAQAASGAPQVGLPLTLTDAQGHRRQGHTGTDGVCRVPLDASSGAVWAYGTNTQGPAFVLSAPPPAPDPFAVFAQTDRPLYRPGQSVEYKATLRRRREADAPGGLEYLPYANQPVTVEIRDATDALIQQRTVTTNAFGSLAGALPLSTAPTLGRWQLILRVGDFRSYAEFQVQEYRKPEYTVSVQMPAAHIAGGETVPVQIDARYVFGQPVARADVRYQIQFTSQEAGRAEPPMEGHGVTDAQGRLTLQIRTQRLPLDRQLSVSATVTDLSRRSQRGEGTMLLTAGAYRLTLTPNQSEYRPGQKVIVVVEAVDYDDKPVSAPVTVTLVETKYDRRHRPYEEKTTRQVTTDVRGQATVSFSAPRPGSLSLLAESFDAGGSKITTSDNILVSSDAQTDSDDVALELVPARPKYQPGDTAAVRLNTSLVSQIIGPAGRTHSMPRIVYALVTLEGERLWSQQVVRLTGRSTVLHIPLTERQFPAVTLHAAIVQDKQLYEQQVTLPVVRDAQTLHVTILPNQDRYQPGQTATYSVVTRDSQGRPVAAEVALGVVDTGVYALMPDSTPDPHDIFWADQQVRVQTDFSFAAMYSGGAFQTMPAPTASVRADGEQRTPDGSGSGNIRVRRAFADTAYWNAFVETGADGKARVTFPVPDNLTTWRATARGITQATQVGVATQDTISSLPLLVRLELPRFAVQGDTILVSAIVHNDTGQSRAIRVHLQATGVTLEGAPEHLMTLATGGQTRVEWQAHITPGSSSTPPALFQVTADGGGPAARDAAELPLPTRPDGLVMVDAQADTLSGASGTRSYDLTKLPPDATVKLTLTPSLGAALFDALDILETYPYGCAEQTASAFLPDVAVAGSFRRLHVDRPVRPALATWASIGLQKLYRYQHADGGWNWWEFDQTDGEMTAYVLSALIEAKNAGNTVDDLRLQRGANALRHLLKDERDPSRRADWLLPLASLDPKAAAPLLRALAQTPGALDSYGQASLCLALAQTGQDALAHSIALSLLQLVQTRGTTAFWPAAVGGYTWREDDVVVTAHVLRALLASHITDPSVPAAVRWLMGNRDGSAWSSTRSSAEAVLALTQYLETSGELHPAFQPQIFLDGQPVGPAAVTPDAFAPPLTFALTPAQWAGHKTLSVTKQGTGTLYLTRTVTSLLPPAQSVPLARGIAVQRTFQISVDNPAEAAAVPSGENIQVDVDLTADANYRYALLEEPIPAGCEVVPDDDASPLSGDDGSDRPSLYVRREVHDNRLVFFLDQLPQGRTHLTYRLRAETPGAFRILPSIASLVYFPEVRGNAGLAKLRIENAK